ncbi:MAG: helical backbone metal receptor [Egibacteraceae bacterium]
MPRVVSLVPSLTDTVAQLGAADRLVGVTDWCVHGAPAEVPRVGGTKNPAVERIVALAPDVVLANAEENREPDLDALRTAGLDVRVTFPRTVTDVAPLLAEVAAVVGADPAPLVADLEAAVADAARLRPRTPLAHVTLVWRRPWMALGPDTYADDLLTRCGFANVLAGWQDRYPRLDPALLLAPEVALLPSEPYAFGPDDVDGVRELLGDVAHHFVDGELLTWHGPRTATALRTFAALAAELAAARG